SFPSVSAGAAGLAPEVTPSTGTPTSGAGMGNGRASETVAAASTAAGIPLLDSFFFDHRDLTY
ncbi:hypothetical protein BGX27_002404, partial [Mortierella sp. AM989]